MAKHLGLSHSTIGRIWRTFGLQPHRSESFRLSRPTTCRKGARRLGVHLVRNVMDRVGYERHGEKNVVLLEKEIESSEMARQATPVPTSTSRQLTHHG